MERRVWGAQEIEQNISHEMPYLFQQLGGTSYHSHSLPQEESEFTYQMHDEKGKFNNL